MSKIKTRESAKDIKVLDKASVVSEHMKKALIRSKDQAENLLDDGQVSPSEYAEDKVQYAMQDAGDQAGHAVTSTAKKAAQKGRDAYQHHREDVRLRRAEERIHNYDPEFQQDTVPRQSTSRRSASSNAGAPAHARRNPSRVQNPPATGRNRAAYGKSQTIKTAEHAKHTIKETAHSSGAKTVKTGVKDTVKSTEKTVKTAEQTSKAAIKTAKASSKAAKAAAVQTAKTADKAVETIRQTAVAVYKSAVAAAKATAAAVKAIIAGTKALISAIAAGGWVAVAVVVVICLIALLVSSCFGIFFSSEDTGSAQTMRQVVQEINTDYENRLDEIKAGVAYDELEMIGSRAVWPEVLSIYAVKTTTDPDNPQEVATITDEKKQLLINIFWEMNEISYRTETTTDTSLVETDDGNGNIVEEEVEETDTILYITVSHKTADEIADAYNFNADQRAQLAELLADENSSLWLAVL